MHCPRPPLSTTFTTPITTLPLSPPVSTDGRFKKKTAALVDYYPSIFLSLSPPGTAQHVLWCSVEVPPAPPSPFAPYRGLQEFPWWCSAELWQQARSTAAEQGDRVCRIVSATSCIDHISFMPEPLYVALFFSLSALSSFRCRYLFEKPHKSCFLLFGLSAFIMKSPSSAEVEHTSL